MKFIQTLNQQALTTTSALKTQAHRFITLQQMPKRTFRKQYWHKIKTLIHQLGNGIKASFSNIRHKIKQLNHTD